MQNKQSNRLSAFILCFITITILTQTTKAYAQPELLFPVSCNIEENCWIVNYVDTDERSGKVRDYSCGNRSYDEHKGTDFALRDLVAMEQGVDVLSAHAGKILRIRDNVEDHMPSRDEIAQMKAANKGCGNGVFIDHGDGWQTIYCHLKKDSIVVMENQKVKAGQKIGQVGHSGIAEFPHLHFGVFFESKTIDPFTGLNETQSCDNDFRGFQPDMAMWSDHHIDKYSPFMIYAAGFKNGVPDMDGLKIDATGQDRISRESEVITFWMSYYGAMKNDKIALEIVSPDGKIIIQKTNIMKKNRARQFYYIGKREKDMLVPGTYTGSVTVTREIEHNYPQVQKMVKTVLVE